MKMQPTAKLAIPLKQTYWETTTVHISFGAHHPASQKPTCSAARSTTKHTWQQKLSVCQPTRSQKGQGAGRDAAGLNTRRVEKEGGRERGKQKGTSNANGRYCCPFSHLSDPSGRSLQLHCQPGQRKLKAPILHWGEVKRSIARKPARSGPRSINGINADREGLAESFVDLNSL